MVEMQPDSNGVERWATCRGFDGRYEVSDRGRVRSLPRKRRPAEMLLRPRRHRDGYVTVRLYDGFGRAKQHLIHRLVAAEFLPPASEDRPDINHKNGVKDDNHYLNLEWSNDSLNVAHAYRVLGVKKAITRPWLGKYGSQHHGSKPVLRTGSDGATQRFAGISEAARLCGLRVSHISACCLGKRKQHGGFQWRFEEQK